MIQKGKFIVFEGIDGSGKTTQIKKLAEFLGNKCEVYLTREPGGCEQAERIRDILVNGDADSLYPWSEALLMNASRYEHIQRVIKPKLDAGVWVLCDRFIDSSKAYQGAVLDEEPETKKAFADLVGFMESLITPDLTLLLDYSDDLISERIDGKYENRFESKGLDYLIKVKHKFLSDAQSKEYVNIVDSSPDIDTIQLNIQSIIKDKQWI